MRGALRKLALLAVILSSSVLGGCWDSKEIGDEAFVTGFGIDYENGNFLVTLQLLDFGAIAKTENAAPGSPNVWIGKAKGRSVHAALQTLSQTSQIEINLEQLKVIIVREPAMAKLDEVLDALNRVRVSRYTSWIFGTKEEIIDMFGSDAFFERSQLTSLAYEPMLNYEQNSTIFPLTMQQFVSDYNERAETAILPSVSIDKKTWKKRKSLMHMERIDGIFAFKGKAKPHYFPIGEIQGVRWTNNHFKRQVITLADPNGGVVSVTARELKSKRTVRIRDGKPELELRIAIRSSLNELDSDLKREAINALARKQIEKDVRTAYEAGLKGGVDLFNFDEILYRYHLNAWRKLSEGGWAPQEGDLKVKVSFSLKYSGVFDLK